MSASLIKFGLRPKAVRACAKSIRSILREGYDTHAEQVTVQRAITAFENATSISHVTVSNCIFNNGKPAKKASKA